MQFADGAGLIAGLLKNLRDHDLARVAGRVVDTILVAVRVPSGEEADARGHAHRGLHERVREIRRSRGQAVEIRRPNDLVAAGAEAIGAELVRHDKEHVRRLDFSGGGSSPADLQESSSSQVFHGKRYFLAFAKGA